MTKGQTLHRYHQEKHPGIIGTNLLTKFHADWTRNVPSRVFTRKTAPPTGIHVFQSTGTTFELNQDIIKTTILTNLEIDLGIIGTNLLTKFHEDRTRNVASRVFTRKTAPPPHGGHVFQRTGTTFELNQDIIKTNILTNFKLDRDIIGTKLLTKFHEDRTRNAASREFTRFLNSQMKKTAPPTGGHVFQRTGTYIIKTNNLTNFELKIYFIGTKLLTKFHEDRTRNVASRPCFFQQTGTTFELNQDIIKTNILTNFKLDRDIIGTKLLTKFHEDQTRNVASIEKTALPTGGHVFQRTGTTFELNQHIIKTNILTNDLTKLLTKFHEDRTRNVASRVFTRRTAPPTGGHVFNRPEPLLNSTKMSLIKTNILTNFELDRDFIETKILTKFHEEQMWTDDGQRPITKPHLSNQVS
ncbi:hypothetical protein DPMN_113426 [Dreissena polymorpha]|uniref:Uncharacterized protein n=1 Tax=Dreissena polymorpha TaxID=45954 RepID=A0A9D4QRU8_DREPO|nr:hypothetical protein DPMN_113426 [Dreissena polymorpha]